MKLKQLTMRGFKSFADRTRIEFASGVSVVVGPNGSGKSNILDAMAWVMGTQATRNLRTEKMEDVVFAGTETRPPLSRAEVSLTFANDDLTLPIDLAEITITRRLFRDGTSEYEMNGAPCRLLDIHELLSDGGVGRQQHVLVGQGQVGEVLNARPDEHRAVIEEAAGVTKHRSRRDRATRRLERTDEDVERLEDILRERRKALRPLKRQANAARRYDAVKSEAVALRLWLGGEELRSLRRRLAEADAERAVAHAAASTADNELATLREGLDTLRDAAGTVGAELTRDTAAAARLETVRERLTSLGLVARERARSISSRREGAAERRSDLTSEKDELSTFLGFAAEEEERLGAELARREDALRELEDEERSLAEQIQLPAESVAASLRGELRSLEIASQRDEVEFGQIAARGKVVDERIAEERREMDRLNQEIRKADGRLTELDAAHRDATNALSLATQAYGVAASAEEDLRIERAAAAARVDALEGAIAGLVDERAMELVAGSPGIEGRLVARLDVPPEFAVATDAALGRWATAQVAGDTKALERTVAALRTEGIGGVSFVLAGASGVAPAVPVAREFGIDALIDLLGPDADRDLAAALLGDVLVVDAWSTARQIVDRYRDLVVVTPEGDILTATGVHVAQIDGAGPAALEAASVTLEHVERELARAQSAVTVAGRSLDAATSAEGEAKQHRDEAESKLAGLTEALVLIDKSLQASLGEADRLNARAEALTEARSTRRERLDVLRARVAEFEGEEAARQAAWEALNARRELVAARRDEARVAAQDASSDLARLRERSRLAGARLEAVESEMRQLTLVPASADTIAALGRIEEQAAEAAVIVGRHIETLRDRQRELRGRVGEANAELVAAEARREELEDTSRSMTAKVAELDVEIAELRVRDEATCEAIRRDADADEVVALAAPRPDFDDDVDPQARLESLLADVRRMGPINPLAAAEYDELAAEVAELETQLEDLKSSRAELKKVIAALDDTMQSLFDEAFSEIAALYEESFALVFPGGSGRLRMEDGDPRSAGVIVEAQPAGKKVGRLSLLSGGERSLAALAFLFAVFRARPGPFYVLDEVEAALDDANLHRFLRLVETLRADTQLVVITHQQQTMEAADVLYGVTMEPGASSQVVSKRMSGVTV